MEDQQNQENIENSKGVVDNENDNGISNQTNDSASTSAVSRVVDDQKFKVEFVAGKIKIPVSKLAEWIPGHVVRNNGVFYPKVKAVCNGEVIAEGELVEMGEQIGFRVTSLN